MKNDKDKGGIVYILFFLQGMANLIPWNCFLNSTKYFERKEGNSDRFLLIPIIYVASKLIFVFLRSILPIKKINPHTIILASVFGSFVSLVCVVFFSYLLKGTLFFVFLCLNAGFLAFCIAIAESGYYIILSLFSSKYTQAFSTGYGISGIITSFSELITFLWKIEKKKPNQYLLFYLIPSMIVIFLAFISYLIVFPKNDFSKEVYQDIAINQRKENPSNNETENFSLFESFLMIKSFGLSLFLVLFTTFSFYPTLIYQYSELNENNDKNKYFQITASLIYNIGNTLGKTSPSLRMFRTEKGPIMVFLNIFRIILLCPFYFLVIFSHKRESLEILNKTYLFFSLSFLFGFSSGNLISLSMMFAPCSIKYLTKNTKKKIGKVMALIFNIGILSGILFSLLIKKISFSET